MNKELQISLVKYPQQRFHPYSETRYLIPGQVKGEIPTLHPNKRKIAYIST